MHPIRRSSFISSRLCPVAAILVAGALVTPAGAGLPWNPWPGSFHPNGGGEPGGGGQPSPVVDGFGDAIDSFGSGPPLLDIDTITVEYDQSELHFSMTFHTPISPPWSNEPDTLVGLFEFDVDQDASTGIASLQNGFSPPFAFLVAGNEYYLVLAPPTASPGVVGLANAQTGLLVGAIPVQSGPTSFSGAIPLSLLGGDDGAVDFTAIVGTVPQPTDAMQTIGFSVERNGVPVPTASTWGIILLGVLLVASLTVKFSRRPALDARTTG